VTADLHEEIPQPVFVVGAGKVGSALGTLWARAGVQMSGLWSRSAATARRAGELSGVTSHHGAFPAEVGGSRTVVIATRDAVVRYVASALLDGGLLRSASVVLHCGGAHCADEALGSLGEDAPCSRGTLHPLLAVADADQGVRWLPSAFCAVEGPAWRCARALVVAMGATPLRLQGEQMALYHAAAVVASNLPVVLWNVAGRLLERAGIPHALAEQALLPLLHSMVESVARQGTSQALTGPVRRGDVDTIRRHLEVLPADLRVLYRACTRQALAIAGERGQDPQELLAMGHLLDDAD